MKAMQFYQRAGDYDRTNALIDRALWRCCTALINASVALSSADSVESSSSSSLQKNKKQSSKYLFLIPRNLKLYPVRVRDAILLGEKSTCSHADHMDLRHYPESSHQAIGTEIETGDAIDLGFSYAICIAICFCSVVFYCNYLDLFIPYLVISLSIPPRCFILFYFAFHLTNIPLPRTLKFILFYSESSYFVIFYFDSFIHLHSCNLLHFLGLHLFYYTLLYGILIIKTFFYLLAFSILLYAAFF